MEAPQTVRPTISAKEYSERRYILKAINAGIHYMQAKLAGFGFDAEVESYADITRVTLTVQWKPQPLLPVIVDIPKPEGSI
jgi:hypothetical protein